MMAFSFKSRKAVVSFLLLWLVNQFSLTLGSTLLSSLLSIMGNGLKKPQ